MQFGHEQRDGYRISIRYVTWAYQVAKSLKGIDRPARDQLLHAGQSIPLNIAEGKDKGTNANIGAASSRSLAVRRWNAHRFRTVWKPANYWLLLETPRVRQC
ncbi:MAG: four helix bundle protein [Chromatiaceae bacterium]